jgi:hypothetical protein
MDEHTIQAFFDELQKIAMAGGQLSESSTPKTPAATPASSAKLAPTPAAKPPTLGPPAAASGGLGRIRNPGLRSQVANTRMLAKAPSLNRGTLDPRKTPAPNLRSVATMPVRRPSKPAFIPKPLTAADMPSASPF